MTKDSKVIIPLALAAIVAIATGYSIFRVHTSEVSTTSLLNDSNLKAYYQFESDGTDTKGSYNLALNNNPTFTAGKYGNGINLGTSNTSTYANIASNLGVSGGGPVTISAWVKLASQPATGYAVVVADLGIAGTSKVEYQVEYYDNAGTKQVRFRRVKQNSSEDRATYNIVLDTTNWHHLVLVYDGTTIWGFVDGQKSSSVAASGNGSSGVYDHFDVGRESQNGGDYGEWPGVIDVVAVFDRALSDQEVSSLAGSDAVTLTTARTADKDVTSSTTLQSDDQLTLPLQPKTYIIDGMIFAKSANVAPGIKFGFSATSASSLAVGYIASNDFIHTGGILTATGTTATVRAIANSSIPIHLSGTVTMSQPGNLIFQWAQNISDADAITVSKGSYLRAQAVQ